MKNLIRSAIISTVAFTGANVMMTSGAVAACIHTEWQNTMPNHVVPQITGRDCNGVLSISAKGLDPQGQLIDLGWVQATQSSENSFTAAFVAADATNSLSMDVDPANKTMHVKIVTQRNDGSTEEWFGDYELLAIK